ncbi:MAG: sulfotransferase [Xanthomonadaceae bacterium]|nr:sulfotransferase [Xanthomonadaceae bacterium]
MKKPNIDPRVVYQSAVQALNQGRWPQAFDMGRQLLGIVPGHGGVHFVMGVSALQMRRMPEAMTHLREATRLSPQRADYAAQYARGLAQARLMRQAMEMADKAVAAGATDPLTIDTLGVIYSQGNDNLKAAKLFKQAAEMVPGNASYRFNHATSLTFIGELDEAEREYEACLAIDPKYWKAHLALAQLKKQSTQSNHLERLRSLLDAADGNDQPRMYLNLAMAKEFEDMGEYPAAFSHLVQGKKAGGEARGYRSADDQAIFDAITQAFPEAVTSTNGHDTREPIFIIGMPRSGTTLVERMLSSHPDVHSAGELQDFGIVLKRASGSQTRQMLDVDTIERAREADWKKVGEAYLQATRPNTGSTPRFIDKLPHNFLYAGFIAKALPNAKLVCLRRNPMDTCLGNFRQLFAQTSPYYDYSFDIMDNGRYWLMFDRLMRHWEEVLPGRILQVNYEDVVADQASALAKILEFCGLPWDDACMSFQDNQAPVATASAIQVREPLNNRSIGRWRRYESELAPLRQMLEDAGVRVE